MTEILPVTWERQHGRRERQRRTTASAACRYKSLFRDTRVTFCDRFGGWSAGVRPVVGGFSCTVHLLVVGGPRREERCQMGRDWRGKQASRRPESTSSTATVQKWFTIPSSQGYIFLNTQCLCLVWIYLIKLAPVVKYAMVIALEAWDSMYTQVWAFVHLTLYSTVTVEQGHA